MFDRDARELLSGGLLTASGLFAFLYALATMQLGTLARMGPGLFPAALGLILFVFGVVILIGGLLRRGHDAFPEISVRPLVAILAGVAGFALTIDRLGAVPAVFVLTLLVRLAEDKAEIIRPLVLASGLSIIAVLIFIIGLRLPVYAFIWPF